MALLVSLGDRNRFVEFAFAKRSRHLLHEYTGLLSRRGCTSAPDRSSRRSTTPKGKENEHHRLGDNAHRIPHADAGPTRFRLQHQRSKAQQSDSQPYGWLLFWFAAFDRPFSRDAERPYPPQSARCGPRRVRLTTQTKDNRDRRIHIDRLAVQYRRRIAPIDAPRPAPPESVAGESKKPRSDPLHVHPSK